MSNKPSYQVRNWSQYNKALVNRGSLTVWFDKNSIKQWHQTYSTHKPGRPQQYSDVAILCGLTLKAVFHLPLRATQGLMKSLIALLKLPILSPDYSTLSRRQKELDIEIKPQPSQGPVHLVIDSTGLKIYGEGEWKVRQHGYSKRRVSCI